MIVIHPNSLSDIQLTTSQQRVLDQMVAFIGQSERRVFILKGFAGTGKTTLMRFLIEELSKREIDYRLLASTGRAAKVLANLSGKNGSTSTIHSMIYAFNGLNKEFDENEEPILDKDGQLFLVFEPQKVDSNSIGKGTIYIVDEASMVSDVASKDVIQAKFGEGRVLSELLLYDERPDSKFIFVGDPCQLPPIEEYYSPALMRDYFRDEFGMLTDEAQLTEIMRQKGGNGIIEASKKIRTFYDNAPAQSDAYGKQRLWGHLPFRQNKDITLHPHMESMMDDYVHTLESSGLNSAVCICRSNRECLKQSDFVRSRLGFNPNQVQCGDLLMVIQNNFSTGLMNGDMVKVEEIYPHYTSKARLTFRQVKVRELFTGRTYQTYLIEEILHQERPNLDASQQQALFVDFIVRMKEKGLTAKKNKGLFYKAMYDDPFLNALRCTYGYAITCHKSQGGEWDEVYLQVPRNITMNPTKENYQWIYTAMTRAKKTLHMVDDFYIV